MDNANNTGRHIEVPVDSTTDRTWVRVNYLGDRVAVVPNPNYVPPALTVDDIQLQGLG